MEKEKDIEQIKEQWKALNRFFLEGNGQLISKGVYEYLSKKRDQLAEQIREHKRNKR